MNAKFSVIVAAAALAGVAAPASAACTTTIGSVMSLTGSLGALGQAISKGAQLGIADIDAAGGANGCTLALSLADDQTSPSVGVDAAKKLVDVQRVPAIVGALSSGVSAAILTSVTAPSGVVQISPASTSPTFTDMAKSGKTHGFWFRTVPSDALQGVAMAQVALDAGLKHVAVLYLNNAYGQGLAKQFEDAYAKLGGKVASSVVYNPSQPSYRSEVAKALAGNPDGLFLIGYPGDGTTVAREWISSGGPQKFLFPDGLYSQAFVDDVGAQYMKSVHGTAPGSTTTPSLATFQTEFKAKYGTLPTQSYITNAYDAAVIIGLAIDQAHSADAKAIRDSIRKVTDPSGEKVYAGVDQLKRGMQLIAQGKKIQYIGASGPLKFDADGDTVAPMAVWTVKDGKVEQVNTMTTDQIARIDQKIAER